MYYDDDGRVLGSMQYGPSGLFPRAAELPAGPPTDDAVLVTCAYLTDPTKPWVMQSLFLTAIGEARDRGARALEAFAYRYTEGESAFERFHVHKTIFPRDFLSDFGFQTVRMQGRVELVRLELGGLQPVLEGTREKVLRVVREAFVPAPAPQRPLTEAKLRRRRAGRLTDRREEAPTASIFPEIGAVNASPLMRIEEKLDELLGEDDENGEEEDLA